MSSSFGIYFTVQCKSYHIIFQVRNTTDDPKRCIRRTTEDCCECRSSPAGCRLGRCGNRRDIVFRLSCCGRLAPGVHSCLCRCRSRCSSLCRCTSEVIAFRPRRSGCVSGRCCSRRVCLGVLWRGVVRTGCRRSLWCNHRIAVNLIV